MNKEMRESKHGIAVLEGVDAATFGFFIEWLYKGYYTPPELSRAPVAQTPASSPLPESLNEAQDDIVVADGVDHLQIVEHNAGNDQSTVTAQLELREDFTVPQYREPDWVDLPLAPRRNRKQESYAQVFLAHARIYVFADERDVQRLKLLALEHLHSVLYIADLRKKRVLDVVMLLRYVYAHTAVSTDQQPEPMRLLLTDYMAHAMHGLVDNKHFQALIIEIGGTLLEDFMKAVKKKIPAPPTTTSATIAAQMETPMNHGAPIETYGGPPANVEGDGWGHW